MSDREELIAVLGAAASFPDTSIVVRCAGAVAEIRGPLPLRRGIEWLTLGEETGSHVHLKLAEVHALRFTDPVDRNVALEVVAADGCVLCRVSFRRTNSARADSYDRDRADGLKARFAGFKPA